MCWRELAARSAALAAWPLSASRPSRAYVCARVCVRVRCSAGAWMVVHCVPGRLWVPLMGRVVVTFAARGVVTFAAAGAAAAIA